MKNAVLFLFVSISLVYAQIDIGRNMELFVDHHLIDSMQDVRLELQKPERREIVFTADAPWEDEVAGFMSVVQDGDVVRLYYRAGMIGEKENRIPIMAMAESNDRGLSFQRPNFGIVEFKGSRDNNILAIQEPPTIPPAFIDRNPDCPPEQRYKGPARPPPYPARLPRPATFCHLCGYLRQTLRRRFPR